MDYQELTRQAENAIHILLESNPKPGSILVVGCSTSEVLGEHIGSASSQEVATAIMDAILPAAKKAGLYLAVQGCEHINRSICVERECMERYGLQEVWVQPWLHAGGAFITEATKRFDDPCMVENVNGQATVGMDIGGTMIGMHMHAVCVPMHTEQKKIGEAILIMAKSRPKYVGGPRARYEEIVKAH